MTSQETTVAATTENLYYDDYVTSLPPKADDSSVARFNRSNIHDVVEIINSIVNQKNVTTSYSLTIIEWLLHEKLPSAITGRKTVMAWVEDEYLSHLEATPHYISNHNKI